MTASRSLPPLPAIRRRSRSAPAMMPRASDAAMSMIAERATRSPTVPIGPSAGKRPLASAAPAWTLTMAPRTRRAGKPPGRREAWKVNERERMNQWSQRKAVRHRQCQAWAEPEGREARVNRRNRRDSVEMRPPRLVNPPPDSVRCAPVKGAGCERRARGWAVRQPAGNSPGSFARSSA